MIQDCKKVRTSTAEFEQHYVSLDIPLDAGAVGPAAPDCGQCWMLLIILCPCSALLLSLLSSLVVYLRCRRKGRVYISVDWHLLYLENTYATHCLP